MGFSTAASMRPMGSANVLSTTEECFLPDLSQLPELTTGHKHSHLRVCEEGLFYVVSEGRDQRTTGDRREHNFHPKGGSSIMVRVVPTWTWVLLCKDARSLSLLALGRDYVLPPTHRVHCKFTCQTGVDPDPPSVMYTLRSCGFMSCHNITAFAKSVPHWTHTHTRRQSFLSNSELTFTVHCLREASS